MAMSSFEKALLGWSLGGPIGAGIASPGFRKGAKEFFLGKPEEFGQAQLYTPEQRSAMSKLLQEGMQNFQFGPIEQQARTNFQTQTIPSLAERFTSMGGGQRSSAFQAALGRAGVGLEENLAALKSQYGAQQLGFGLGRQFEPTFRQAQPGFLQQSAASLMQFLPMLAYL